VVVRTRLPDVPVIVTELVPVVALLLTVKVSMLVVVAGFGERAAVTPFGSPEIARDTFPLNPPIAFTEIVLLPLLPCLIETLDGEAVSVKPGTGFTTRVTEAVAVV